MVSEYRESCFGDLVEYSRILVLKKGGHFEFPEEHLVTVVYTLKP